MARTEYTAADYAAVAARVGARRECPKCNATKPLAHFGLRKQTNKRAGTFLVPQPWCRTCRRGGVNATAEIKRADANDALLVAADDLDGWTGSISERSADAEYDGDIDAREDGAWLADHAAAKQRPNPGIRRAERGIYTKEDEQMARHRYPMAAVGWQRPRTDWRLAWRGARKARHDLAEVERMDEDSIHYRAYQAHYSRYPWGRRDPRHNWAMHGQDAADRLRSVTWPSELGPDWWLAQRRARYPAPGSLTGI